MLKTVKARMEKDEEEGFTLIELLVVVLILGILMAIAIPTFLSLTSTAKANAAEASLTTAVQDAATYYTQNGTYNTGTAGASGAQQALSGVDTGTVFSTSAPAAKGTGAVWVVSDSGSGTSETLILNEWGADGKYYWVKIVGGQAFYDIGTGGSSAPSTAPTTISGQSWSTASTY